jgi:hypothetical protein
MRLEARVLTTTSRVVHIHRVLNNGPTDNIPGRRFLVTLTVAVGMNALWAGAATFRVLVDLPARHHLGPLAFADLSRATDLASGLIFYPTAAIGSAVLCGATWLLAVRTRISRAIRVPTAIAFVSTMLVLAMTTQAAPLMFRIGAAPSDPGLLADLADRFTWWTNLRAASADVAAVALLYALATCALRASRAQQRT